MKRERYGEENSAGEVDKGYAGEREGEQQEIELETSKENSRYA